ncbi:MAG: D-hexose-6-phosphate mutarotase [Spirochaetaceae bacterium]|nr:D-hexose-6-phosphate mutarotase [Spirochaetaceae bacterium]
MDRATLSALKRRFDGGSVAVEEGPGGLAFLRVRSARCRAVVSLQGAQVLSFAPAGGREILWLGPLARYEAGRAIRGGVPLCFPWFGAAPAGGGLPAHGYARLAPWDLVEAAQLPGGEFLLRLVLPAAPAGAAPAGAAPGEPAPGAGTIPGLSAECAIRLGTELDIEFRARNASDAAVSATAALHGYLAVGDARRVSLEGLEGLCYADDTAGGAARVQEGPVSFPGEVDRRYVGHRGAAVLVDPVLRRRLVVEKRGSASTVVWNPGPERARALADLGAGNELGMVCVETARIGDDALLLAPGGEAAFGQTLREEALA